MPPILNSNFERDPSWVKYFRLYAKDLREVKTKIKFSPKARFECQKCGACCDFTTQQHRCLLSWVDVARWHAAGFDLGLFFLFPAHSIDGFSALGIPTKGEMSSGKFSESIRAFDERRLLASKLPELKQLLGTHLGNLDLNSDQSGVCLYLGPHHECLIHPIRPGACRLFPFLQANLIQVAGETPPDFDGPCPPQALRSKNSSPADGREILRDCAEAEAAAWAQERVSLPEVENLLVQIWREILPKF